MGAEGLLSYVNSRTPSAPSQKTVEGVGWAKVWSWQKWRGGPASSTCRKARATPRDQFRREVERELTGGKRSIGTRCAVRGNSPRAFCISEMLSCDGVTAPVDRLQLRTRGRSHPQSSNGVSDLYCRLYSSTSATPADVQAARTHQEKLYRIASWLSNADAHTTM